MDRTWCVLVGFLALALGMLVSHQVHRTLQARTAYTKTVEVVIATSDIGVGAKIEYKDIKVVNVPVAIAPPDSLSRKSQVLGRGVVLPIAKGEFILPHKLAPENAGSGLPGLIPPGMRAVAVRVNEVIPVAAFVGPGTRVDVLLTRSSGGSSEQATTTVMENAAVIAVGMKLERNSAGELQSVSVITLLVSPQDAKKLTLASSKGRIQVILRNPLDQKVPWGPRLRPIPPEVPLSPRLSRLT
jgi:pilus assembly protein CpaB